MSFEKVMIWKSFFSTFQCQTRSPPAWSQWWHYLLITKFERIWWACTNRQQTEEKKEGGTQFPLTSHYRSVAFLHCFECFTLYHIKVYCCCWVWVQSSTGWQSGGFCHHVTWPV